MSLANFEVKYIIKRNGEKVLYNRNLIFIAINKAFHSENVSDEAAVDSLTTETESIIATRNPETDTINVETVQDIVEEVLMQNGYHKIVRNYIVYREQHKKQREEKILSQIKDKTLQIKVNESDKVVFNPDVIENRLRQLTPDLFRVSIGEMVDSIAPQIYENIPKQEIELLVLGSAKERIEKHYEYSYLASRISLNTMYKELLNAQMFSENLEAKYQGSFSSYIKQAIDEKLLNAELLTFNLNKLAKAIAPERDRLFHYLGIQILSDRYLIKDRSYTSKIIELPQWFWMRVSMGLALKEKKKEDKAIEFYNVLSKLDLVSSTPTLFNSGTNFSQMSSCYLNTVDDSLEHIFKVYSDNAKLSKWAGGIGTDWSNIRATGSKIHGTNGLSQGIVPFLKIFNDVALAVNQGGKRKGAMCAYMELWHLDIEQFLELKKNTGDERRRAHDINTACWIPDLFLKRLDVDGDWTLFCPSDAPELHDLYGAEFEKKYIEYEEKNINRAKTIKASVLWRKMLTMLFETGHPWITFKDAANIRSPQDHVGVVHSSNLCTEITLNTSKDETAVCNLASINLSNMVVDGRLDEAKIEKTLEIGIRMLDNVIDNNFYPTKEAENANMKHRAIGLGLMGYQDALFKLGYAFDSEDNLDFADRSMEMISFYAIKASSLLSKERGSYKTFKGSKWDRGIFPVDTLDLLEENRGKKVLVNRNTRLDWLSLKQQVKKDGMRNSNVMAIAPTATIANISGVYPCTEPVFKNIYMKENLSGNFVVINRHLIDDLEKLGIWNNSILAKIKLNDGSIQKIEEIPVSIRKKYKETFEIETSWIIKAAALRGKWIDQSASTNIFLSTKSGKAISDTYRLAWDYGLKTTYYLRTLAATQVAKATVGEAEDNVNPEAEIVVKTKVSPVNITNKPKSVYVMDDADCEACQ